MKRALLLGFSVIMFYTDSDTYTGLHQSVEMEKKEALHKLGKGHRGRTYGYKSVRAK